MHFDEIWKVRIRGLELRFPIEHFWSQLDRCVLIYKNSKFILICSNFFRKFYSPSGAYCTSKAAQVMMMLYLNQKLNSLENSNVKVFALHPGVVKTDLYVNEKWLTVSLLSKKYLY